MSSMMDFASALGGAGGGPPPGPPAGGPPPEAETGETAPDQEAPQYSTSLEALDAAEEALHAFIQLDPDEADRAVAGGALQTVLKLKASNQTSAQSGDLKSLARALQGGPAANAGPIGQAIGG